MRPTLGWHLGVAPGWARQGGGGRGRDQKAASCDPPLLPGRHRRFCRGRAGRPGPRSLYSPALLGREWTHPESASACSRGVGMGSGVAARQNRSPWTVSFGILPARVMFSVFS